MTRQLISRTTSAIALALAFVAGSAEAQELYSYSVILSGGIGGSFDAEPDPGLGNTTYQLEFSFVTAPKNRFSARLGRMDFSGDRGFAVFPEAELTYLTLGGEYRARRPLYDSGVFFALGGYRLEGTTIFGTTEEDTAVGLSFGTTADFPINRWLSIRAELAGHFTDLEEAQFFGALLGGVAVHF